MLRQEIFRTCVAGYLYTIHSLHYTALGWQETASDQYLQVQSQNKAATSFFREEILKKLSQVKYQKQIDRQLKIKSERKYKVH